MHRAALIVAHQRSGRRPSRERIDQAAISRRYRDQGDPRFCGRITGMSGDVESANWLVIQTHWPAMRRQKPETDREHV